MRIFLDANILFSAAKSDGAVRLLLALLREGGHVLCADAYVIAEARRNIEAKSVNALPVLEALEHSLEVSSVHRGALPAHVAPLLPQKDRPVLAAAIRLRCAALVTGDRAHFGSLYGSTVEGVAIHSPRSLAETLLR